VHAQPATVWKVLLDEVENPQRYLHGVESTEITERTAEGVVREMRWDGKTVKEMIVPAEKDMRIVHELLEHPIYEGRLLTRMAPTSVQNPMAPVDLQVSVELERKSFHMEGLVATEAELAADIEKELLTVKERAEELERREG
jgi:hypothetical protein